MFSCYNSYFLQAKAMLNNFRKFKEPVFFDLWIPDPGFRILGLPCWDLKTLVVKPQLERQKVRPNLY